MKILIALLLSMTAMSELKPTDMSPQSALNAIVRNMKLNHDPLLVPKQQFNIKFGTNLDIDSAAEETVWANGGMYTIASGAETLNIVSADANDAAGDTGAQLIVIQCITEDYTQVDSVYSMNGTGNATFVSGSSSCRAINRMTVIGAGSSKTNEGIITATQATSGLVLATIPVESSVTRQLVYTVPEGKTAYIAELELSSVRTTGGQNPTVNFELFYFDPNLPSVANPSSGVVVQLARELMDTSVSNHRDIDTVVSGPLRERSTIYLNASTTQDNTRVSARLSLNIYNQETLDD